MRVTNEVLNQWIDTKLVMHRNGDVEPISENRSMKSAQDMAHDLLEARELIKEMRNYFGIVRDNSLNPAHTITQLGLEETTDANHKIALMMIAKSKDYA